MIFFCHSVVGVSASHDVNAFCYNISWRLQDPKREIIDDFKEIVADHLKVFKEKNGNFPATILYYRDGVSEGQFDQVMAVERRAMVSYNECHHLSVSIIILKFSCDPFIVGCVSSSAARI